MSETFTERTAGIWVSTVFYAIGGAYILAFWAMFSLNAYHLLALGVASLLIAALLFLLSKWAYWLGVFTFPLLVVEFAFALYFSVNVAGWTPNPFVTAFNVSMIVYLVLLCISFLLLIDRRNTLKGDRIMDRFNRSVAAPPKEPAAEPKRNG